LICGGGGTGARRRTAGKPSIQHTLDPQGRIADIPALPPEHTKHLAQPRDDDHIGIPERRMRKSFSFHSGNLFQIGNDFKKIIAVSEKMSKTENMLPNNLSAALLAVAAANHESLPAAARRCRMAPPTLYRIIRQTLSPHGMLKTLCGTYATTETQARQIIQAHILDEIDRAGMTAKSGIQIGDETHANPDELLVRNLSTAAKSATELKEILDYLSTLYPAKPPAQKSDLDSRFITEAIAQAEAAESAKAARRRTPRKLSTH
jgi:hypothetical protein